MPYLLPENRESVHLDITSFGTEWTPENAGELNFAVSMFISNYLVKHGTRYKHVNEMIGALECAKLELYRAVVAPYEVEKAEENGPVY